ncbi:MAG: phenylacetate--CoA ligase family protein [Phycisphaerales bacterium]|nr:MAG: phenylacetate--CoA ligase family protein [Phycisphaerales bacterium]
MSHILDKIRLCLATYRRARAAVKRQFRPEAIIAIQNQKLGRLIRYSFESIKYYRELCENAGIDARQIQSARDLCKIPVLTREQFRARFWDFLPRELPACRLSRTSGSTGVPICILSDANSRMFNSAGVIRYRRSLGVGFAGRPILTPLKTAQEPSVKKAHWTFLQGIHKTYYVNPYVDSAENTDYAGGLLNGLKRPAVIGITPAVRTLAYKVRDGVFPAIKACAVLTTGESLAPDVRELLVSTFAAPVADIYACNEAGDVAWQCLEGAGYHINADNVIVEVLRNDEPAGEGEIGEVVITNLNRYAMPIIRYKNGDLAKLTSEFCPCGCRLPMIAEIAGRTGEDIFLPGGKVMPWNQLKSQMNHPQIRQFQLVQTVDGSLNVRYVPDGGADTSQMETLLLERYRKLLGPSVAIEVEAVEKIAPAASGKSKLVVSHYKPR